MSLFQNSVSFGKGFRKTVLKDSFSFKSKVAFPKAEVLEKLRMSLFQNSVSFEKSFKYDTICS